MYNDIVKFEDLTNKTITEIEVIRGDFKQEDSITFTCSDDSKYRQYHSQDCCESVNIEDICGDTNSILNTPVINAYESCKYNGDTYSGDEQWTFYNINTVNGSLTIRWYGSSNGYYSTAVYFEQIQKPEESES